jgi:hypothetical protein
MAMSQKTESNGWDRTELNLKLSKRRRDLMVELAKRLAPGATPTEVIDYALSQAPVADGDAGAGERFADLEDAIERATMEQRFANASMEESIKALARGLEALRSLISEVAAQDDSF